MAEISARTVSNSVTVSDEDSSSIIVEKSTRATSGAAINESSATRKKHNSISASSSPAARAGAKLADLQNLEELLVRRLINKFSSVDGKVAHMIELLKKQHKWHCSAGVRCRKYWEKRHFWCA